MLYFSIGLMALSVFLLLFGIVNSKSYNKYIPFIPKDYKKMTVLLTGGIALGQRFKAAAKLAGFSESYAKFKKNVDFELAFVYGKSCFDKYSPIYSGIRWVYFLSGLLLTGILSTILYFSEYAQETVVISVVGMLLSFLLPFTADLNIKKLGEKKRSKIISEFPLFLNKLMLLVNSGATVSNSWQKMVVDKSADKDANPLYGELLVAQKNIHGGISECDALDSFARCCKCREISRAVSIISINLKKGGSDVVALLRDQVDECFVLRKNRAKAAGEKASTKLVFPMMLTLIALIIAIGFPAYLQMTAAM